MVKKDNTILNVMVRHVREFGKNSVPDLSVDKYRLQKAISSAGVPITGLVTCFE